MEGPKTSAPELARAHGAHDLRGFFDRAHLQNIIGQSGAGVFTCLLTWSYANHDRLLFYLAVHTVLITTMGVAFYGRLGSGRRDPDGIPSLAMPTLIAAQTWVGSVLLIDYPSSGDIRFVLSALIIVYACAAGTMVTLGPIRRLSRAALASLLVPGAVVAVSRGFVWIGAGTVFFMVVVAVVGAEQMHQSFQELLALRASAAEQAERSRRRAATDDLTSLLNRRGINARFHDSPTAYGWLIYLDLDRFKAVNDEAGHLAGDELLIQLSGRLTETLPDHSAIARMGGDEFIALVPASIGSLDHVVDTVRAAVESPYRLSAGHWRVGVSIGVARVEPGASFEMILRHADQQMFADKDANRTSRQR